MPEVDVDFLIVGMKGLSTVESNRQMMARVATERKMEEQQKIYKSRGALCTPKHTASRSIIAKKVPNK
jgi:hypothetical protein